MCNLGVSSRRWEAGRHAEGRRSWSPLERRETLTAAAAAAAKEEEEERLWRMWRRKSGDWNVGKLVPVG